MLRRMYNSKRRLRSRESSQETAPSNYSEFHIVSGDNPNSPAISTGSYPSHRSGHRVFTTRDYLYLIGGYDSVNDGTIFRDVWRMNLFTKQWIKMEIENMATFPEALASFSICQMAPYSNQILLFGGTGIPFGIRSSADTYILTMMSNGKVRSELLNVTDRPRAVYGHAMVPSADPMECKYYSIGGTTGHNFFLNIDSITWSKNAENSKWVWENVGEWGGTGDQNEPPGLYRLECIIDKNRLLMFGGGTPDYVQPFDKMYYFDLTTHCYALLHTHGDPKAETPYPTPRRCHSITQWGRNIVMAGGCGTDIVNEGGRTNHLYNDVWLFDLDKYQWTKHPSSLNIAVFFHSAAITVDGCLFVHGGVSDERSLHRTSALQALWLSPPNLLFWSSQTVLKEIRKSSNSRVNSKKSRSSEKTVNLDDLLISRCDTIYSKVVGSPA